MPVTFQVVGNLADFGNEPRAGVKVRATASPGHKVGDISVHSNQPETVATDEDGAFTLELVSLPGVWYRIHTPYSGALPTINLAGYVPDVDDRTTGTAFPPDTVVDVKDVADENPAPGYEAVVFGGNATWAALPDKPDLADVATSGEYGDLTGKPTLSTVAATGAYGDLTGKPTLGTAAATAAADYATAAQGAKADAAAQAGTVLRIPTVDDLPPFFVIGHRGSGNLFPEHSIEGMSGALSMGVDAIEAGDLFRLTDGGLVVMHDATVDRTTTGSGPTVTYTTPGVKRLRLDAASWFGGGWGDLTVPTFDDALVTLAGHSLIAVELKDAGAANLLAAQEVIARAQRLGIERSLIVATSSIPAHHALDAAGIPSMWTVYTMVDAISVAGLVADGVDFAAIDLALIRNGTGTAWAAEANAAGLQVVGFTADRQSDYDTAVAAGLDGIYSNDPLYAGRRYAAYRTASSGWHVNGTWGHGMLTSATGPLTSAQRGSFVGAAGAYRWKPPNNVFVLPGEVCPVPTPAGTYSVTVTFVVEGVPSTTSQGAAIFVCAPDDKVTNLAGNVPSSYLIKARATGVINAWKIDPAGAAAALTGLTTTAWSLPVLSGGLTAGAAITSLPVNALTVAVKSGHKFVLPTGQVATASGAAAVSATAIPVTSITPSAAVSSGATLLPQVTVKVDITPTTVTFTRLDEPTAGSSANTESTNRGAYIVLSPLMDTGGVSFSSVVIA